MSLSQRDTPRTHKCMVLQRSKWPLFLGIRPAWPRESVRRHICDNGFRPLKGDLARRRDHWSSFWPPLCDLTSVAFCVLYAVVMCAA